MPSTLRRVVPTSASRHSVRLREDVVNNFARDIRESIFASLKRKRQSLVIYAEQMQHGRMQVMHVNFVVHGNVTDLISGTVGITCFCTAPR